MWVFYAMSKSCEMQMSVEVVMFRYGCVDENMDSRGRYYVYG